MKITLRQWQSEAIKKTLGAIESAKIDFLCEAGVGSGKTIFAAEVARLSLDSKNVTRIVVVTYTRHLVKQWKKALSERGVILQRVTSNDILFNGLPNDVHGYVMTYQAMSCNPDLHAQFVSSASTMVIIDEIHHLGEDGEASTWGMAAKYCFEKSSFRLALSGTPFRSSGRRIPFVEYKDDENGNSFAVPDYKYSYGKSVADEVCRQLVFKPYYGHVKFRLSGDSFDLEMRDKVKIPLQQERLRNANKADILNDLMTRMIKEANDVLTDIRDNGDPLAAGLIIANTIEEARLLSKVFTEVTGEAPVVVLSDEDYAHKSMMDFVSNSKPWMASVRMVSEGVDIPRLRVLVYCSNITEDLYVIQALGRIVRQKKGIYGPSYVFFPGDRRLLDIAEEIEAEVARAIKAKTEQTGKGSDPSPPKEREFISAEGEQGFNILAGKEVDKILVRRAEELRAEFPILGGVPTKTVVDLINAIGSAAASELDGGEEFSEAALHDVIRDRRRKDVVRRGRHYAMSRGVDFSLVFGKLCGGVKCPDMETASNPQLAEMLQILKEWETHIGPFGSRQ